MITYFISNFHMRISYVLFICNFHMKSHQISSKLAISYLIFSYDIFICNFHIKSSNFHDFMISYIKSWDQFDFIFSWFHDFIYEIIKSERIPADPWNSVQIQSVGPHPSSGPPLICFHDLMIILMVFEVSQFAVSCFHDIPNGFQPFWRCARSRRPWAPDGQERDHLISWFDDIPNGFL